MARPKSKPSEGFSNRMREENPGITAEEIQRKWTWLFSKEEREMPVGARKTVF